jgi:pyruvate kinase
MGKRTKIVQTAEKTYTATKVVSTLGPASFSSAMIRTLVETGVDVFRINMSHAAVSDARKLIATIRSISSTVAILVDTKGPELRTTEVDGVIRLVAGRRINVRSSHTAWCTDKDIYVKHDDLIPFLAPGVRVYLDDGLVRLVVEEIEAKSGSARCLVERGGEIRSRRGVNVPGVNVFPPELTPQDIEAIQMAGEERVEFLAASFVQSEDDVRAIRECLEATGATTRIISKIETREAVDRIGSILSESDGIMVARGDLGVEIPPEEVPLVQKHIIRECNRAAKPVIVATQMLESMITHPVATRAETSDVANAILDGTDAVMLSGETAKGRYPAETVATMVRISDNIERSADLFRRQLWRSAATSTAEFIAKAVCRAVEDLSIDFIIALTVSGRTARLVSSYKPSVPILAITPYESVGRQLALSYGVRPFVAPYTEDYDNALKDALTLLLESKAVRENHRVVVTAGIPMARSGTTNFLSVDTVKVLLEGAEAHWSE